MVSQNRPPPVPVPVQVPQGQVMQQYVNENGTLTHVVLSQYPNLHGGQGPHMHAPFVSTSIFFLFQSPFIILSHINVKNRLAAVKNWLTAAK